MRREFVVLYMLLFLGLSNILVGQTLSADQVLGKWNCKEGGMVIEISKSENAYVGKIVGLKNAKDDNGNPILDTKNRDITKRDRQLIGITILTNLVFQGNKWVGDFYNPISGFSYSYEIETVNGNLDITGYQGVAKYGEKVTWTKVNPVTSNF